MTDFKLDPITGDLDITNGLSLVEGEEEMRQRINLALSLNLAEWFADITRGLPWFENPDEPNLPKTLRYMLGSKAADNANFISQTITDYLEQQPYIQSVTEDHTFDESNRIFTYNPYIIGLGNVPIETIPFQVEI